MGPNFERMHPHGDMHRYGRPDPYLEMITLAPLGGAQDDWPRIVTALSTGKIVYLSPGTYYCKSNQYWPSGSTLVASEDVEIRYDMGVGGCVFMHHAETLIKADSVNTTLAVLAVVDANTITVTDSTGMAVGDRIIVWEDPTNWDHLSAFEIRNIVGNVLTLDAPVDYPYPAAGATTVYVVKPAYQCRDIRIHGNGMRVVPNGAGVRAERAVEFVFAWDCIVEDIQIDGSGCSLWGAGYDSAGRHNAFRRIKVHGDGAARPTIGLVGEFQRDMVIEDCEDDGTWGWGQALLSCVDSSIVRPVSRNGIVGIAVGSSMVDTQGTTRGRIVDPHVSLTSNYGIIVGDGSTDTIIENPTIHGCTNGILNGLIVRVNAVANRTSVLGGEVVGGGTGIYQAALGSGKLCGCNVGGQTTNGIVAFQSKLEMDDCELWNTGSLVAGQQQVLSSGAGARIRARGTRIINTSAAGWFGLFANVSALLEATDTYIESGAGGYGACCADAGVRIRGRFTMIGGAAAFATSSASASLWVDRTPEIYGGTIVVTHFVGTIANCSWGTWVAAGAAGVVVGNLLVTAACHIDRDLVTIGGAPAGQPFESAARVVGTSFTVAAVAGDTSTYSFRLRE